jgi:hypothetical protein
MRALGISALPTKSICTPASLAGEVLHHHQQNLVVTAAAASLILAELLAEDCPEVYRASSDKPGFTQAFWESLGDAESRGFFPDEILKSATGPAPPEAFLCLQDRLHKRLEASDRCTPGQFLLRALKQLDDADFDFKISSPLFIGPLLSCDPLNREFLNRLVQRAEQVLLAPAQGVSPRAILSDTPSGSSDSPAYPFHAPAAEYYFLRPSTPDAELDAAFAMIACWVAEGRCRYGGIRLAHPHAQEALPHILSVARRFQVPVRASFGRDLRGFPGVISLRKLLVFFESGWQRRDFLDVLRSHLLEALSEDPSMMIIEKSRLIEAVLKSPDPRTHPPWAGWLEKARDHNAPRVSQCLTKLADLDDIGSGKQTGAAFASWMRKLAKIIQRSHKNIEAAVFTEQDLAEEQSAWEALDAVFDDLTHQFSRPMSRGRLLAEFDRALSLCHFLSPDPRHDAVEIVPAHRDDFLPIPVHVYLGLDSKVPSPDRHNPFLAVQSAVSYDEKLGRFRQVCVNAQKILVLSCPRFNEKGDELALSPFLNDLMLGPNGDRMRIAGAELLFQAEGWSPEVVRPKSLRENTAVLRSPPKHRAVTRNSLDLLTQKSARWSPTSLNHSLQCQYLHFAHDVLALKPRADSLIEAVTNLILGNIAHQVLEGYIAAACQGKVFDLSGQIRAKFERETARFDPHLEIDRAGAELRRCLEVTAPQLIHLAEGFAPHNHSLEVIFGKKKDNGFEALAFDFGSLQVRLEGKIDRLDRAADNRTLVVEYKYRKADGESQNDFFDEIISGDQPQLPLYWLVARDVMDLRPVALMQIYLRSEVTRILKLPEAPVFPGEDDKNTEVRAVDIAGIEQMLANARNKLRDKALALASGDLTAKPRDFTRCGPGACDYADLCRFREA